MQAGAKTGWRLISDWHYPLLLFLGQRILLSLLAVALFILGLVPQTEDPLLRPYFGIEPVVSGPAGALVGVWQRFDSIHYQRIAEGGYSRADLSPFFPLFPLLSRALAGFMGGDCLLAGFVISNLAALFSLLVFHAWMLIEGQPVEAARRSLLFFAWFPTAFFLFLPYAESLFLLLVLLTFWHVRRQSWLLGGVFAALACLTRMGGLVLAGVIILEGLRGWRQRSAAAHWRVGLAVCLPLLALAGLEIWRLGARLPGLLEVQAAYWDRSPSWPWKGLQLTAVRLLSGSFLPIEILDLLVVVGMLGVGVLALRRLPLSLSAYHWGMLLMALCQVRAVQPLSGQARYAIALVPAFIVLGRLAGGPIARRVVAYGFLSANLLLAGQFVLWGWVG